MPDFRPLDLQNPEQVETGQTGIQGFELLIVDEKGIEFFARFLGGAF
jgi:hypothetical protein